MRVTAEIFPAREERTVVLPASATGFDLLKTMHLAPDAHLIVRGETPLPLDEPLVNGETLRVIAVVSGGRT
jgi:sulfur carrier protein ThiS